ncbi:hypothetical protein BH10PSE10_BH10PSE10_08270 [soil metagenome]
MKPPTTPWLHSPETAEERVLDAVVRARGILADYIEPGPRDCEQTLTRLFYVFDDEKLIAAVNTLNLKAPE